MRVRAIRTVGACVLALAVGSIAAGTAAAAEEEYPLTGLPEIGRCVKVEVGTGKFNLSNCIGVDKDGNDGQYDWKPGPAEHGTFKLHIGSPTVETVGKNQINCTNGFLTGEYLNGKELKVTSTVLQGCLNVKPNKDCFSNSLEKGTIESNQELVGMIGFIANPRNPSAPFTGVDLKAQPESLPLLMFNCGEMLGAESIALEGSVIGKIAHPGKMLVANSVVFSQKKGHQIPEAFQGGVKDTITETVTPISNPLAKTSEQAALAGGGELSNGEAIEFKSKQH
jgi:hypothetical protein